MPLPEPKWDDRGLVPAEGQGLQRMCAGLPGGLTLGQLLLSLSPQQFRGADHIDQLGFQVVRKCRVTHGQLARSGNSGVERLHR